MQYLRLDLKTFQGLIGEILDKDSQSKFLIKEEKKVLKFASKIFINNVRSVSFEDHIDLIELSFDAVLGRLKQIKKAITTNIKNKKFKVDHFDHEYFFSLENILLQVEIIDKDLTSKNWYKRNDKDVIINKILIVFKNLNQLALSLALDDRKSIPEISQSILRYDNIKFNISPKLIL